MNRVAALVVVAAALAAGSASGDVFAPVPNASVAFASGPVALPSADVPNPAGSLLLPGGWTEGTHTPASLDYPALLALWQNAGSAYGVPWPVLAAINKIESNLGRNMGPSSAGAVGWMQFMPGTWLRWGVDASGDRIADPWNPKDGVYAAARYLAAAGGRTDIARAVFAYNHADWYVRDVLDLARVFGEGADTAFTLDRIGEDLREVQLDVVRANRALVRAVKLHRKLARIAKRLEARAEGERGFTERLAAQKRAVLAAVRRDDAAELVAELRARLAGAQQALASARAGSQGVGLAATGSALLGAPAFQDGYVFPVGGGPAVVSVSAGHHDYPAADIAAPAGSPLYALAAGVVERSWRYADSRCGVGFTLRSAEGLAWTYCHLGYLEPSVQAGAVLNAGTPVGLVGSTGRATGPHLHLQLQPPTLYPQRLPWFQAFAGRAFRWDGEPAPPAPAGRASDVFGGAAVGKASGSVVAFTR